MRHEKDERMHSFDRNPANRKGTDISRIDGFVTTKSNEKYRRLGKISIFLQGRLK